MSIKRKLTRIWKNKKNNGLTKVQQLAGALAVGMTMLPVGAHAASSITDASGANLIDASKNVHNIYAQNIAGTVATNKFTDFKLEAKQIANLYFRTSAAGADANALVNLSITKSMSQVQLTPLKATKSGARCIS